MIYTFTYNSRQQLKKTVRVYTTSKEKLTIYFSYDKKNRVTKKTLDNGAGNKTYYTYQYNEKNQMISRREVDNKGKTLYEMKLNVNSKGYITEINGYKYEFDKKGNMVGIDSFITVSPFGYFMDNNKHTI